MDLTNQCKTHLRWRGRARLNPRAERSVTSSCLCVVMVSVLGSAPGCVRRIPEPLGGHTNAPHVGWVIMSGDADNADRDFVCQSIPRNQCVLPVDRSEARVLAHVHLYYHGALTETRYTGSIRIEFFDQPHEINPGLTVKPGDKPGNQSVSDFVSAKPGMYTMSIDVVATSTQTGETQNIREAVSVTVK